MRRITSRITVAALGGRGIDVFGTILVELALAGLFVLWRILAKAALRSIERGDEASGKEERQAASGNDHEAH